MSSKKTTSLIGTGGAIPVRNEKGELTMQKVKVSRYVAGKRPKYAPSSDNEQSNDESEQSEEEVHVSTSSSHNQIVREIKEVDDKRLKRLMESEKSDLSETAQERIRRHRHVAEPAIIQEEEEQDEEIQSAEVEVKIKEESDEEEIDENERIRRRMELKKKALQRQEELLKIEEEQAKQGSEESESEEESEYEEEEYSDSEDEIAPRLKPVFVRKSDRVTIQEKEAELEREKELEIEREKLHLESVKQTKKIIEQEVARERMAEKENDDNIVCDFLTDEENDENDYEAWKLRELKRIKRDREEREKVEKEKQEIQKIRNMTEEERLEYLKQNPKEITNKSDKGNYKFLQKYYHRGAFFMDKEEEVYKRNYAEPTLEDHFDKTILPKVMQVKNFGFAGRTKYTHLVDQDTSRLQDNPWANQEKFLEGRGGGTKQVFENPTAKKRK